MNILLFLIAFFCRPICPPVTADDIRQALILENRFSFCPSTTPTAPENAQPIPGRFVIGFEPTGESHIIDAIKGEGGTIRTVHSEGRFLVVELHPATDIENLQQKLLLLPGVRFVEPDFPARICRIPNDPMFLTKQWDKWVMYADRAWDITTGGNVKVAVVDNGVEYFHPDLTANFRSGELGYDFINNDNDPRPDNTAIPEAFHGTHVAGIIAGASDNATGIAGWAQVQLLAVRVLNDSGSGTIADVARGIRWATDHGARVINLSLASDAATTPLIEACQYALSRGTVLCAAAGNDGDRGISYPARLSECIAVGATNELSGIAYFSNYGPEQEVVAPGVAIYSTATGGAYVEAQGTSMSCPQVSGVIALLLSRFPSLSPNQVRAIIAASAIDMGQPNKDDYFGYGLVNAARALEMGQILYPAGTNAESPVARKNKTIITTADLNLPAGTTTVTVFDATGRLILKLNQPGRKIHLPAPGSYFLILHHLATAPSLLRALVLP